ncbi:MAG: tyrosine--tRNA ligase [Bacteroidota bacterium]|nr:tyrosine--tRNA ligase [Bacteroidota bacterium]
MKNFIEELSWRGMIQDMMPGTEEQLSKELTTAYIGFDPTAASLHIGNLAAIMLLKHLQLSGHKPIALVGGATGMIGDPTGKSEERNLLDEHVLRKNQEGIKNQLSKFLDFNCGDNSAEIVNNYDWFKEFSFLDFLRDAGKHITVNYMLAKDSVKKRLETGLSFTEFSYQLLQGYDFYWLYKTKNVRLQMGGSDQWGNITTGTEYIRRKANGVAFALTTPLITKADGTKFGKSEGENIWLDPEMTSPYKFYQFWLNTSDEDATKLIRVFTLLPKDQIQALEEEHGGAPHLRILQKSMAREITSRVHSENEYEKSVKASEILFGKSTTEDLKNLDEKTLLAVFEGVPQVKIDKEAYSAINDVTTFLSEATIGTIFPSKGEARKMIQGGGVSINKTKLDSPEQPVDFQPLQGKYLLVQKGKKNYFLVCLQ